MWEASEDGDLRAVFRDMSFAELMRVRDLLVTMQREKRKPEEVEKELKRSAPALLPWFARQAPDVKVAAVSALLIAIQILVSHLDAAGTTHPSPVVTERVVVQLERGQVDQTQLPRRADRAGAVAGSGSRTATANCTLARRVEARTPARLRQSAVAFLMVWSTQ